ncbi:MAG: M28 family peptidase [Schleiferiaceae bacterium]|nr:M28 family peptidase [Schleiferiaceae bacterium]
MKKFLILVFGFLLSGAATAQVDSVSLSNATMEDVLKGNYAPGTYPAGAAAGQPDVIACNLVNQVSPDSLWHFLQVLTSYGTRHTFSDTTSANVGIGAARRYIKSYFDELAQRRQNRLLTGYLTFDITRNTCGTLANTRNVMAVLPGSDPQAGAVLIQAHMDSRCADVCDSLCLAPGADDNGSGTALVMELARTLSQYQFPRSLVFMLTTGEEQGLLGATAFADYVSGENIPLHAVQNNDIVGGIICGNTASPPGCNPGGSIDSTHVRIYANPFSRQLPHQGLAKTIALLYREKIKPALSVPMHLDLMNQEDRTGRGGDHQAFRQVTRNVRFTSAHEHGNGNPLGTPNYQDHQHTSADVLGVNLNADPALDSFFVDRNYLARNAIINATSATWLAYGPQAPSFNQQTTGQGTLITITGDKSTHQAYRVGVKDFSGAPYDQRYHFTTDSFLIPGLSSGQTYKVGIAAVDTQGITGPFSVDIQVTATNNSPARPEDSLRYTVPCAQIDLPERRLARPAAGLRLGSLHPNPTRAAVDIPVLVEKRHLEGPLRLRVTEMNGKPLWQHQLSARYGRHTVRYTPETGAGFYLVQLRHQGRVVALKKLLLH